MNRPAVLLVGAGVLVLPISGCGSRDEAAPVSVPASTSSIATADREALIATGDPRVLLDCPDDRPPLESPSIEYPEDTPLFDTAREAVDWFLANARTAALGVELDGVSVLYDDVTEVEVVRSPDNLTTRHFYVPALIDGRVQAVLGASYDRGPDGLIVNEIVACEGAGLVTGSR